MTPSGNPSLVRCQRCGATMDVPSGHHEDGLESLEGRTAKCPRCGHVNAADSSTATNLTAVKDQQMLRRV